MIKRKTLTLVNSQRELTIKPSGQRDRVNAEPMTLHDTVVESKLKLPSERDESVVMTTEKPDPIIKQAAADLARGMQDTSKAIETDQTYKKLK